MTPEISEFIERSDEVMGGWWGNHISWLSPNDIDLNSGKPLCAYGHKPADQVPKVGDKIAAEFQQSWIMLEVVDIERKSNPPDMFFLDLTPIEQIKKPDA